MSRGRKREVGSFSEPALRASPHHHCLWPASGVGSCDTQADDGNSRPLAWRCRQPWPCPRNACLQVSEPILVCTWHKSHSGLGPESSFPKQKSDSLPCSKTLAATHPIDTLSYLSCCFLLLENKVQCQAAIIKCLSASFQLYSHCCLASSSLPELFTASQTVHTLMPCL